jgi:hypothetical protein
MEEEANAGFRTDAEGGESPGDAVGPAIEGGISPVMVVRNEGDSVGAVLDLRLKQMDDGWLRSRRQRSTAQIENALTFRFWE